MNTKIETITVNEAKRLLDNNIKNRRITRANVSFIKRALVNGEYKLNGETIVVAEDGTLLDGQHRLTAVVETGIPMTTFVVRGIDKNNFKTINTGKSRNAADIFSIEGVKNAATIASATRLIMEKFKTNRLVDGNGRIKLSNDEIYNFYTLHKDDIDETVEYFTSLYNSEVKILSASFSSAMCFLLSEHSRRYARSFMRELYTGIQETESNCAILLRKRILNAKLRGDSITEDRLRDYCIYLYIKYSKGKSLKKLEAPSKQTFDIIQG
jgi:hypothetical protein